MMQFMKSCPPSELNVKIESFCNDLKNSYFGLRIFCALSQSNAATDLALQSAPFPHAPIQ